MADKPYYPKRAIGSLDVLANTLGMSKKVLQKLSTTADQSYTTFTLIHPSTYKERSIANPHLPLKKVQKKLNSRIFSLIEFPPYLQGGLKSSDSITRDYINNAAMHCNPRTLITLDIENFYPNISKHCVKNIFKNFFRFPNDVADVLTKLTTFNGIVPQGGCSSSYLANLALHNSEYSIVSYLRSQGINYSRLIDDITISSDRHLDENECSLIIKKVAAMLKKNGFKLKGCKTKVLYASHALSELNVTGLWVKHAQPKLPRIDRKFVRLLVYTCEKQAHDLGSLEYHKIWNQASGAVAQLQQLGHSQAKKLRERLSKILPIYDISKVHQVKNQTYQLLKKPSNVMDTERYITFKRVNQLLYRIGIVGRTHPKMARNLRNALVGHFGNTKVMKQMWEK